MQWRGIRYKTGTGQKWTKEYTWEDYVFLRKWMLGAMPYVPRKVILWNMLAANETSKFFEKHPETLLEAEPFKGLSLEEIKLKAPCVEI